VCITGSNTICGNKCRPGFGAIKDFTAREASVVGAKSIVGVFCFRHSQQVRWVHCTVHRRPCPVRKLGDAEFSQHR
jgi:hypothetical protein